MLLVNTANAYSDWPCLAKIWLVDAGDEPVPPPASGVDLARCLDDGGNGQIHIVCVDQAHSDVRVACTWHKSNCYERPRIDVGLNGTQQMLHHIKLFESMHNELTCALYAQHLLSVNMGMAHAKQRAGKDAMPNSSHACKDTCPGCLTTVMRTYDQPIAPHFSSVGSAADGNLSSPAKAACTAPCPRTLQ